METAGVRQFSPGGFHMADQIKVKKEIDLELALSVRMKAKSRQENGWEDIPDENAVAAEPGGNSI